MEPSVFDGEGSTWVRHLCNNIITNSVKILEVRYQPVVLILHLRRGGDASYFICIHAWTHADGEHNDAVVLRMLGVGQGEGVIMSGDTCQNNIIRKSYYHCYTSKDLVICILSNEIILTCTDTKF